MIDFQHFKVKAYQTATQETIAGDYGGTASTEEMGILTQWKAVAAPTCA